MLGKLRVWVWCFMHLPRIFNLAQTAAIRSASSEPVLRDAEQLIREIDTRLNATSTDFELVLADYRKIASGKLELLELERKEVVEVINRTSDLQKNELAAIKRELLFLQRRVLPGRPDTASTSVSHTLGGLIAADGAGGVDYTPSDSADLALEDYLVSLNADAQSGLEDWIKRFAMSGTVDGDHPLVHIGCGSGSVLVKAQDNNLIAYGTIANKLAADTAVREGLTVKAVSPSAHLASLSDQTLGGLLATRVIERMSVPELVGALDHMHRVLRDGAVLILQCANPENLQVGSRTRQDIARTHLIHPQILAFLVENRGFQDVEIVRENPVSWEKWLDRKDENSAKLNALLFGPQDYCVIARRT